MSESNLVVLTGSVSGEPQLRQLATGQSVVQFDVTIRDDAGTASVPVAWFDPPARHVEVDQPVVVVGAVRRRFFRAGGATQSRTEVVAERVVPASRRAEVRRALTAVAEQLAGP